MNVKGIPGYIETYAASIAATEFGCTIEQFRTLKAGGIVDLPEAIAARLLARNIVNAVPEAPAGEGEE